MKQPVVEQILVKSSQFIADNVVEIKGWKKGTKAPREYTVHFTLRGEVKFGHMWLPDYGDYLRVDAIPTAVKQAAIETYKIRKASDQ
jgi:hypothetical protein